MATASHSQFPSDSAPDSLNIEHVSQIHLTGDLPENGFPPGVDLYVSGNLAVMGDFRGIVHIVDISGPTGSFASGF